MRKSLSFPIILCFCLSTFIAGAQNIVLNGIIRDSANQRPMAGVSVFLNGTSKGTVTRGDGTFSLSIPPGRYQLIASAIGYANYLEEISSHSLPTTLKITLHTSAEELASVTVEPYVKDGWKKYGRTFLQYFIGTTANAADCTIKNKEALRFHWYIKSNQLAVTAVDPLLIENKALGYELEYRLERFVCDYASVFLEIFSPFLCSPPRKLQPNRAVAAGTMSVTNTKVLLHEMQRERR